MVDSLHRKGFDFGGQGLLSEGTAWVLVEFGGAAQEEADGKAHELIAALGKRSDAPTHRLYDNPDEESRLWEIRRHTAGAVRQPIAGCGQPRPPHPQHPQ